MTTIGLIIIIFCGIVACVYTCLLICNTERIEIKVTDIKDSTNEELRMLEV